MSDADAATSQQPAESSSTPEQPTGSGGDGLWGLTTAFGGGSSWGLGGLVSSSSAAVVVVDDGAAANQSSSARETGASDAELAELESSIAAAETAVSTAIWSTLTAVSDAVVGGPPAPEDDPTKKQKGAKNAPLTDEDLDAILTGEKSSSSEKKSSAADVVEPSSAEAPSAAPQYQSTAATEATAAATEAAASAASSIWSSLGAAVSETLGSTTAPDPASSLYSLYTSNVNRAAEWIEDLERADAQKDPYKRLKENLNAYVTENPTGSYEDWVELYLSEEGWDKSSTVAVDSSYYAEECPHRILWNERNYQDGIQIGDPNPKRAYVPTPSTNEDRRHKPTISTHKSDEEIITFDGDTTTDDEPNKKTSSQKDLFNDDESNVIVMPTPVPSSNSLDKNYDSNDEDGILVPQTTPSDPSS
jgi:hypothetical protein